MVHNNGCSEVTKCLIYISPQVQVSSVEIVGYFAQVERVPHCEVVDGEALAPLSRLFVFGFDRLLSC